MDVLSQIREVLGRIGERLTKIEARGVNVAEVKTAIDAANRAIVAAEEAVKAQAAKSYPINVTTDANLRADVASAREAFNKDIRVVRDLVQAAREAVRKAAVALANR